MAPEPADWIPARRERLGELIRAQDYRGWDPFDLPNSPFMRVIPDRWWLPQLAISKAGARVVPDWLRRALRVPYIEDPKIYACTYFGYRWWPDGSSAGHAREVIERLAGLAARNPDGGAYWGYDYTWATPASGVNPRGASTIVPGAFAIFALLDDLVASTDDRHRDLIGRALDYYRTEHQTTGPAGDFLAYFKGAAVNTHNANLLGSTALSLGGRVLKREDLLVDAARTATTTIRAVDARGYLPYADHRSANWTDCFHHLYTIACASVLERTNPHVDRKLFSDAVRRMRAYVRQSFLRADGLINYYPGRLHPIDPHNYAAAAIFAVLFGNESDLARSAAEPLLRRVDELAWNPASGRYRFRLHARRVDSRHFLRWTQAWMFAALSLVYRESTRSRMSSESTRNFVAQLGN